MTTNNCCFYLQNRLIQTSQTGGQQYSDLPPLVFPGWAFWTFESWVNNSSLLLWHPTIVHSFYPVMVCINDGQRHFPDCRSSKPKMKLYFLFCFTISTKLRNVCCKWRRRWWSDVGPTWPSQQNADFLHLQMKTRCLFFGLSGFCGLYYKTITIVNDDRKWCHNLKHHLQS